MCRIHTVRLHSYLFLSSRTIAFTFGAISDVKCKAWLCHSFYYTLASETLLNRWLLVPMITALIAIIHHALWAVKNGGDDLSGTFAYLSSGSPTESTRCFSVLCHSVIPLFSDITLSITVGGSPTYRACYCWTYSSFCFSNGGSTPSLTSRASSFLLKGIGRGSTPFRMESRWYSLM